MSYKVTEAFIEHSRSKHGSRTVGLIFAEVVHHDGVGWLRIEPSKSKRRRAIDDTDNIVFRTKLSAKQVRNCVDRLQDLDELEVVRAWDGRIRYYVYRLIVEPIRRREVDYQRGGLSPLEAPFWTVEELELPLTERPHVGHEFSPTQRRALGLTSGKNFPSSTAVGEAPRGEILGPDEGKNAPPPSKEPVLGPVQTEETYVSSVPAGAGERESRRYEISLELGALLGVQLQGMTRGERGAWESAVAQLVDVDASPQDVRARASAYRLIWPGARLTPLALVKHWSQLGVEVESGAGADPIASWCEHAPDLFDLETAREILDDRPGLEEPQRNSYHRLLDEAYALRRQVA